MISCDEALALLSASLDDMLSEGERALLDEHLSQCQPCRALLADFQAMQPGFFAPVVPPPAQLKDNIMAGVRAAKVLPFDAPTSARRHHWKSWGSLVAVLAVVVLGGGGLGLFRPAPPATIPTTDAVQPALFRPEADAPSGGVAQQNATNSAAPSIATANVAAASGEGLPQDTQPLPRLALATPAPTDTIYCGIVVLSDTSGLELEAYPYQQVDCEIHYTLPAANFQTLLPLLEGRANVTITLEGTALAPDAATGVVIVTPVSN